MLYYHVDVFSSKTLSGNGLTVVFPDQPLPEGRMLAIAQELRQFETIFIHQNAGSFMARIFTVEEELNFAGHPVLGAAAIIHQVFYPQNATMAINLSLPLKEIGTESAREQNCCHVKMNQGEPEFITAIEDAYYQEIAGHLNLNTDDLHQTLPIEVISTGLPYLLVPVRRNLAKSRIVSPDFEQYIAQFGAKFVYIFDPEKLECRTWDNGGKVEDVATGSAAGPLCAYLIKYGLKKADEIIELNQGRYINRPSIIRTWQSNVGNKPNIFISGDVTIFAKGELII
jgi:trans-2,3-dihydro-3-hydroxyanthranilate isomerase